MNAINKLRDLGLPEETMVSLSYSDSTDVFVHNDTAVDTAVSETDVVNMFSELIATPRLHVYDSWGNNVLDELRGASYLDDYEPREFHFSEFLAETLVDNFYDLDGLIEDTVEQYDYKRGYCTLSADVQVPIGELLTNELVNLSGWTVSVSTDGGTFSFEA